MILNQKTKKVINYAVLALFVLALTMPVMSQEMGGKGMRGPGMMKERGMKRGGMGMLYRFLKSNQEELNISGAQLEKIKKIHFDAEEKKIALRNKMALQKLEMKKLMSVEGKKDYKAMEANMAQTSELRRAMFIKGLKTRDSIQNILTEVQKEALKKLRKQRRCNEKNTHRRQNNRQAAYWSLFRFVGITSQAPG